MIEVIKVTLVSFVLFLASCDRNEHTQNRGTSEVSSTKWDEPAKVVYTPPWPEDVEFKDDGNVVVHITINISGFVDSARIEQSSKHAYLDSLALESIRKTVWTPAKKDGNPVPMQVSIPYMFRIRTSTVNDIEE